MAGGINTIKISIKSKAIYRFMFMTSNMPISYFSNLHKNNSKVYTETQETLNS